MHLTLQFKKSSLVVFAVIFVGQSLLFAQAPCGQPEWAGYFEPLTNGEGLRYPLSIGPLSWRLLGHQIQPVKGSDGMIHVAYALLVTNSWNRPATLKSIEVVDPAHDNG